MRRDRLETKRDDRGMMLVTFRGWMLALVRMEDLLELTEYSIKYRVGRFASTDRRIETDSCILRLSENRGVGKITLYYKP